MVIRLPQSDKSFISKPTMELTDMNCGRAMEQLQVLRWSRTSTAEAAAVLHRNSQPLATPSISQPPTEATDSNCGRATEQPRVQ